MGWNEQVFFRSLPFKCNNPKKSNNRTRRQGTYCAIHLQRIVLVRPIMWTERMWIWWREWKKKRKKRIKTDSDTHTHGARRWNAPCQIILEHIMHTQMDETTKWKPNETWIEMKENSSTTTGYARIVYKTKNVLHTFWRTFFCWLPEIAILAYTRCLVSVWAMTKNTFASTSTQHIHVQCMRCELFATVTFCTTFS